MPENNPPEEFNPEKFDSDPKYEKERERFDAMTRGSLKRINAKAQAEEEAKRKEQQAALPWPFSLFSGGK